MSQAWVLLWLPLSSPSPAEQALIDGWARQESVLLSAAQPSPRAAPGPYRSEIVAHIERSLESSRVAFDAADIETGRRELATATALLRENPGLPQAPWLMAEALELEALAARSSGALDAARAFAARAASLSGPRSRALSQSAGDAPSSDDAPAVEHQLVGPAAHDAVYLDGTRTAPQAGGFLFSATRGVHHVRVVRHDGEWSTWLEVTDEARTIELALPRPKACSVEDLAVMRRGLSNEAAHVSCPSWLAARPVAGGAIEVSYCKNARCGPFERWPASAPPLALKPAPAETRDKGTPWWGYALLGTAAAAATATVLIWTGTQSDGDERDVWVYRGVR